MTLTLLSLWVVFAVLAALAVFQIALALGAPLGHMAWGGGQRVLSRPMRIASLVAIVLYGVFALVLAERAGFGSLLGEAVATVGAWVIAAYGWIGAGMNAISRSRTERFVMTPVALVLAVCATAIALG